MLPQYRVPARPTVRRRLWRRVLPQCLLVLSTQHLVLAVLIMFAGNVWRQDKASFWIDALSVALLADVFYTGCAIASMAIVVCWALGLLVPSSLGLRNRLGLAVVVLTVGYVGWFALLRIEELHGMRVPPVPAPLHGAPRQLPRRFLGLRPGCHVAEGGAMDADRGSFVTAWRRAPSMLMGTVGRAVCRPWSPLSRRPQWWEHRERLVGAAFWLLFAKAAARALGRSGRHGLALEASTAVLLLLALFLATAEPCVWVWRFFGRAWGNVFAMRALLPEEGVAVICSVWLVARQAYITATARLERRRTAHLVEERVRSAMEAPFFAELEGDDFAARPPPAPPPPTPARVMQARRAMAKARRRLLRSEAAAEALLPSWLVLKVKRSQLVEDSIDAMLVHPISELLAPSMRVRFDDELGIDAGGLSRDWFDSVARALAQGASGLGPLATSSDGSLWPRPAPGGFDEAMWMRCLLAVGRFVALAVLWERLLPLQLSPVLCKHLLRRRITAGDIRALDPDFARHRVDRALEPDGLEETARLLGEPGVAFLSAPTSLQPVAQELVPGGAVRYVQTHERDDYVRLLCEARVCGEARRELTCFLFGFWDLLPLELLEAQRVSPEELSVLISGSGCLNPKEWRRHSRCAQGSAGGAEVLAWFWEAVVAELTEEDRVALLRFVTGSSIPPPGGFCDLRPPFSVEVSGAGSAEHLPHAHTCANKLVLHRYASKAQLLEKLLLAVRVSEGFGVV